MICWIKIYSYICELIGSKKKPLRRDWAVIGQYLKLFISRYFQVAICVQVFLNLNLLENEVKTIIDNATKLVEKSTKSALNINSLMNQSTEQDKVPRLKSKHFCFEKLKDSEISTKKNYFNRFRSGQSNRQYFSWRKCRCFPIKAVVKLGEFIRNERISQMCSSEWKFSIDLPVTMGNDKTVLFSSVDLHFAICDH